MIIDPDENRKRKISLEEWINWLQRDHLTDVGEELFNNNKEFKNWKKLFLEYAKDDKLTFFEVEQVKNKGHWIINRILRLLAYLVAKKSAEKTLESCLKDKNRIRHDDSITWNEFISWINALGK